MSEIATIVSIISLITSFLTAIAAAGVTGWVTLRSADRREQHEGERLISRYRDPIYLAARDLAERIDNLLHRNLSIYADGGEDHVDTLYAGTAFAFGQFFAWTYILRQRIQFVRFATGQRDPRLSILLQSLNTELASDSTTSPFMIWSGFQMAMGEVMCERDSNGELLCIGYSTFYDRYKEDIKYRKWFGPVDRGLDGFVAVRRGGGSLGDLDGQRLRAVSILLLEVVDVLERDNIGVKGHSSGKAI